MEVRLALSVSRKRQRQPHSDAYADFDPRIEWREGPHSYILLVYVPGFKKEDLMVEMDDATTMTISGERRLEEMVMVGSTWHRLQRRGQNFSKQLRIPDNVNTDAVAGRFEPGILYIILPKLPSSGIPKPPEDQAAPDLESSSPVGIRIEDVSLQPEEEAPSLDARDPSRQFPEVPEAFGDSDGATSEDRVPYLVESPEEEISTQAPKDSDEGMPACPPDIQIPPQADDDDIPSPSSESRPGTPPQTPREPEPPTQLEQSPRQTPFEPHHRAEEESADMSPEEPSPPQVPPNPAGSPERAEELEKRAEDSGAYPPKPGDAVPAADPEPSGHMQPPIPPVEEHEKHEEKEGKTDELEEEEDGVEEEQPRPDSRRCCCTKYALLSFLAAAVVAFIAHQVRRK